MNTNLKSIKLIISKAGMEELKAFADDSYLYRYIVNNYTELSDTNIFHNPDIENYLSKENLLFVKFNLSFDDELVIKDALQELIKKNATFYAYVSDDGTGAFFVCKNFSGKINLPIVDNMYRNIDDFEVVNNIESYINELENQEEMEV